MNAFKHFAFHTANLANQNLYQIWNKPSKHPFFSQFKHLYVQNLPRSLAELKLESTDVVFQ